MSDDPEKRIAALEAEIDGLRDEIADLECELADLQDELKDRDWLPDYDLGELCKAVKAGDIERIREILHWNQISDL